MPVAVSLSCLVVVCAVSYRRHHRLVLLEAVQCTSRWFWFTLQYPRSCFCNKQRIDWWGRSYKQWNRSWLGYSMVQALAPGGLEIAVCCVRLLLEEQKELNELWQIVSGFFIGNNMISIYFVLSTFPNEKMV